MSVDRGSSSHSASTSHRGRSIMPRHAREAAAVGTSTHFGDEGVDRVGHEAVGWEKCARFFFISGFRFSWS